jgi:hypothetical protein
MAFDWLACIQFCLFPFTFSRLKDEFDYCTKHAVSRRATMCLLHKAHAVFDYYFLLHTSGGSGASDLYIPDLQLAVYVTYYSNFIHTTAPNACSTLNCPFRVAPAGMYLMIRSFCIAAGRTIQFLAESVVEMKEPMDGMEEDFKHVENGYCDRVEYDDGGGEPWYGS